MAVAAVKVTAAVYRSRDPRSPLIGLSICDMASDLELT